MIANLTYSHLFLESEGLNTGLQYKSADEVKKPMIVFLDERGTPVGVGIYVTVLSGHKVLAHDDQLPNKVECRCKMEIGNEDYFGLAKPFMTYQNRYYLLHVSTILCKIYKVSMACFIMSIINTKVFEFI